MKTRSTLVAMITGSALALPGLGGQSCDWMPAPSSGPQARFGFGLVYDPVAQRAVLFGGSAAGFLSDETWLYDGSGWTMHSGTNPPGVDYPGMAYDAARNETVLFGGLDGSADDQTDQTWVWDGQDWEQRLVPGPPARGIHAMAFDAARSEVVLFGGWDGVASDLGDTWVWDGNSWTQRTPANSPSPREGSAMAYDAARQQIVLFGGYGFPNPNSNLGDTWVWNGSNWIELDIPGPPARSYYSMTYDSDRDVVVLWGGFGDNDDLNDMWEFDGTEWRQIPASGPTVANSHGLVYDSARARHILKNYDNSTGDPTTWELSFASIDVTSAPGNKFVSAGAPITLSVDVTDDTGLAFQWLRNGAVLMDGPGVSGAQTSELGIAAAAPGDTGIYSVRISDACSTTVLSAVVGVLCPGDSNGDGVTNFADLNLTISNFNTSCGAP